MKNNVWDKIEGLIINGRVLKKEDFEKIAKEAS